MGRNRKGRNTKRRVTKRRDTKRINTNKRNTNKRNTNKRNTKNRITNKVNDKSDINKFIRKNLPGYKLIKILNSKQTGGDIYTDYSKYITAGVKLLKFDKEKDFVAAPTFSGARPGFTFQTGEHGSGYYRQATNNPPGRVRDPGGDIFTDYSKGVKIGEGGFGRVFLAENRRTRKRVVIKEFIEANKTLALNDAKQEYFFGQIVNALKINNTIYQQRLDDDKSLSHNMIVLYTSPKPTAGVKQLLKFDKEKDFVAAPTFSGARPGFTFQTGEHGSGYYRQAEVKEEPVCDNYLALYEGITLCRSLVGGGDGAAAGGTKMHSLVVFNVDTNNPPGRVRDLCKGSRKGTSTHTYTGDIMNHGGFKLFNALKEKVNKDSIRLPPRVKDNDYREVKVPTYIKRYGTNIVMEYIEGKTLKDYFSETIVNAGSLINEYKLKPVIIKVLEFIAMINNSYLSHNDYNFNNIMVDDSEPDNVSVTVIDYGIMSVTGYYHFPNTHRVPGEYYGPKPVLLNGQPDPRFMRLGYNIADGHDSTFIYNNTDIYAFFESLVIELNNLIFNALKIDFEYKVIIEEILSNYRNQSLAYYFQHWSPEFKDFMKLAFTYDKVVKAEPYGSTPADTLLDHPWLR